MMLHEINCGPDGRNRRRRRIGRGESSGWGKTAGRGHKGAGQRAGRMHTARHEGGRVPYFRRIPKRGFSNFRFRTEYQTVNLGLLEQCFQSGEEIDPRILAEKGIIREADELVKVLADGKLTKVFSIKAHKFSAAALEAIKSAGGSAEVIS